MIAPIASRYCAMVAVYTVSHSSPRLNPNQSPQIKSDTHTYTRLAFKQPTQNNWMS